MPGQQLDRAVLGKDHHTNSFSFNLDTSQTPSHENNVNIEEAFPTVFYSPYEESPIDSTFVKPRLKVSDLNSTYYVLPDGQVFVDKYLPSPTVKIQSSPGFTADYFITLHQLVSSGSINYPPGTPNHRGARISLEHSRLKIGNWRKYLSGYDDAHIVQFLEFGFPLGLSENPKPILKSSLQNHGSAYQYFDYIDSFISMGLERHELAGPFEESPFHSIHISPLMTAPKKPHSRRAVFDATFGEFSLNNNTPRDSYCDSPCVYDYPSVDDFKHLVLKAGRDCYIWKRDLSRFYLQIPLDPVEYPKVCCMWRKKIYFFVSLMFGLTHSGLQGQKVTRAVTWIHRNLGLASSSNTPYTSLNYSDDIGGVEVTMEKATESFEKLGDLFGELGLDESVSKAHSPSTKMPYLGVEFNTTDMTMSVPGEKLEEVRHEVSMWLKKRKVNKRGLQRLLGKLFWVSRCVRFSRGFMGRLLSQLRELHLEPDYRTVPISEGCKADIRWWARYLRRFNGVELMYPEEPLNISLDELVSQGAQVYCGDAQPLGGGAYCGEEYWSQNFPEWLQDVSIPIHVKEFYVVIASAILWGHKWRGKLVYMFCDNMAVVQVLEKEKPKDQDMAMLLREFLYIVCTRGFTPIFRHVGSKVNQVADFLSRNHDQKEIENFLKAKYSSLTERRSVPSSNFSPQSMW